MLLISWRAVEWKTYDRSDLAGDVLNVGDDLDEEIPITQQVTPPPPPPPPPPAPEVIQVVEDEAEVEETIIDATETYQLEEIVDIEEVEEVAPEVYGDGGGVVLGGPGAEPVGECDDAARHALDLCGMARLKIG